jgi:hypothetical protein
MRVREPALDDPPLFPLSNQRLYDRKRRVSIARQAIGCVGLCVASGCVLDSFGPIPQDSGGGSLGVGAAQSSSGGQQPAGSTGWSPGGSAQFGGSSTHDGSAVVGGAGTTGGASGGGGGTLSNNTDFATGGPIASGGTSQRGFAMTGGVTHDGSAVVGGADFATGGSIASGGTSEEGGLLTTGGKAATGGSLATTNTGGSANIEASGGVFGSGGLPSPVGGASNSCGTSWSDTDDASANDDDAGTATIGVAGKSCSSEGAYGCAGHAQRVQLVCRRGCWQSTGDGCESGTLCDTRPEYAGMCQPVAANCVGRVPGFQFCQGQDVRECGVDLVTSDVVDTCHHQTCQPATGACQGVCEPGEVLQSSCGACNEGNQSCGGNGYWTGCTVDMSIKPTWYQDQDKDGFGNPNASVEACEKPSNYVSNNDDCCDTDANAFPKQSQFFAPTRLGCGGFDYDCDGKETAQTTPFQVCDCPSGVGISCTPKDGWAYGQASASCASLQPWAAFYETGCGARYQIESRPVPCH